MHSLKSQESIPDDAPLPVDAATAALNRSRRMRKHADRKERLHKVLRKMNSNTITAPKPTRRLPERLKDCSYSDEDKQMEWLNDAIPSVLLQPSNEELHASFAITGGFLTSHGQEEMERKPSANHIAQHDFHPQCPTLERQQLFQPRAS
jgi:hypothetical protein